MTEEEIGRMVVHLCSPDFDFVPGRAIVMDGGQSPQYMRNAAKALSETLPKAAYRTLPGQTHMIKASAVAPAVKEFLSA